MSFNPQGSSQHFTPKSTFELNAPGLQHDPFWYRKAVFYEVLVRAFADANGDGSGDFSGLIDRLDYLQWLGVDCLWLPPFFQSPLRDGGYDISDYNSVLTSSAPSVTSSAWWLKHTPAVSASSLTFP